MVLRVGATARGCHCTWVPLAACPPVRFGLAPRNGWATHRHAYAGLSNSTAHSHQYRARKEAAIEHNRVEDTVRAPQLCRARATLYRTATRLLTKTAAPKRGGRRNHAMELYRLLRARRDGLIMARVIRAAIGIRFALEGPDDREHVVDVDDMVGLLRFDIGD